MAALEAEFRAAERDKKKIDDEITELDAKLKTLNDRYEKASYDQRILQEETDIMERRLIAADKLISGLGSENTR